MRSLNSLCICIWLSLAFPGSLCYQSIDLNKACQSNSSGLFLSDAGPGSAVQLWSQPRLWTSEPNCTVTVAVPSLRGILACVNDLVFEYGCNRSEHLNLSSDTDAHSLCAPVTTKKHQRCLTFFRYAQVHFGTVSGKPPEFSISMNSFQVPPCGQGRFACEDETMCVWTGLVCNGLKNCLDRSDENGCFMPLRSVLYVILGIVPVMLVCAMILIYCILKNRGSSIFVARRVYISPSRLEQLAGLQVAPETRQDYKADQATVDERHLDTVQEIQEKDKDTVQEKDRAIVEGREQSKVEGSDQNSIEEKHQRKPVEERQNMVERKDGNTIVKRGQNIIERKDQNTTNERYQDAMKKTKEDTTKEKRDERKDERFERKQDLAEDGEDNTKS